MSQERRRFYRIEDSVILRAYVLGAAEIESKLEEFKLNPQSFFAGHNLNQKTDEQLADLRTIQQNMPELARYLTALQRQVDRLSAAVLADESTHQLQEKRVSLSAQGISFSTDDIFKPVDMVELHLQLIPSGHQLLIYSRVVMVEDNADHASDGSCRVSLDFEHIHDADRETLVKHVHSKQLRTLGTKSNEDL